MFTMVYNSSWTSQHLIATIKPYCCKMAMVVKKNQCRKVAQYTRTYECLYTNGQNVHLKMHNEESGGLTRVDFDGVLLATEL